MHPVRRSIESAQRLLLDEFSDKKISEDFFALSDVVRDVRAGFLQFDLDGRQIRTPVADGLAVISVVLQNDVLPRCTHVRVVAVLGGASEQFGLVEAGACFVLLKYNELGELISYDYLSRLYG